MEQIGAYLIRVCCGAIVCGIVTGILGKKGMLSAGLKQICGIFMVLIIAAPLVSFSFTGFSGIGFDFKRSAEDAVDEGKISAQEALEDIITEKTAAYILDKAKSLGVTAEISVTLSDDEIPVPSRVTLKGNISPYAKGVLSQWMATELAIPTEAQVWI